MILLSRKYLFYLLVVLVAGCAVVAFCGTMGDGGGHQLTVVTYNAGTLNGQRQSLRDVVDAVGKKGLPGLVLLQEVPDEAFLLRVGEDLGLRYHAFGAYNVSGKGYGLGILSRGALVNPEIHLLKPCGHAVLTAQTVVGERRLVVCSVHLQRVRAAAQKKDGFELSWGNAFGILKNELMSETPRSIAVEEILNLPVLNGSDEVIIGGDFNTVPFSTAVRRMERSFDDALWPTVDYFTGTYTKVNFPVAPRIDYIFCSGGVKARSAGVIRQSAGDHYPVWGKFRLAHS